MAKLNLPGKPDDVVSAEKWLQNLKRNIEVLNNILRMYRDAHSSSDLEKKEMLLLHWITSIHLIKKDNSNLRTYANSQQQFFLMDKYSLNDLLTQLDDFVHKNPNPNPDNMSQVESLRIFQKILEVVDEFS